MPRVEVFLRPRRAHAAAANTTAATAAAIALLLTCGGLVPAAAQGLDGRVLTVQGDVRIDGAPARVGQMIGASKGAAIVTGVDGRVQLRLADGTVLALPASSEAQLSATEARQLTLARGGLSLSAGIDRIWRVSPSGIVPSQSENLHGSLSSAVRSGAGKRLNTNVSRMR